ncbi:MAG TPA: type II toxin-antitoxin system VapC family toxin [Acetobacteraceae bacterium]|jgi:predicted nucleic-acid-binding protein
MTVAIDTNILVRYLTWDDLAQAKAAARLIESGETIAISSIVLCELVWVLRCAYRLSVGDIADSIRDVIESRNVVVDRPAAEMGLAVLRDGSDFADGIIQHDAERARCRHIATFDRDFAVVLGAKGVVPK